MQVAMLCRAVLASTASLTEPMSDWRVGRVFDGRWLVLCGKLAVL